MASTVGKLTMETDLSSYDLQLIGHGSLGLSWEDWGLSFRLAQAFGWEPAGTLAPGDYTHCGGPAAFIGDWHGGYFTAELQQVTDMDAKALSAALRAAISAWDNGQDMSVQQLRAFVSIPKSYDSLHNSNCRLRAKGRVSYLHTPSKLKRNEWVARGSDI